MTLREHSKDWRGATPKTGGQLSEQGFSLIEILMSLMLISILTYVTLEYVGNSVSDAKFDETVQEMKVISDGMVGNKNLRENGARTSFGYLGDVGALPASINDLITKPAGVSAYSISSTYRIAVGWNGPYVSTNDPNTDYTKDAWINAYSYSAAVASITSYGADKVAGGTGLNQDIVISFPTTERLATVEGFVSNAGSPISASYQVILSYPDGSGNLAAATYNGTPGNGGYFSFSNIPFGVRSISAYQGTAASYTYKAGPVIFTVDKPRVLVPSNQIDVNP